MEACLLDAGISPEELAGATADVVPLSEFTYPLQVDGTDLLKVHYVGGWVDARAETMRVGQVFTVPGGRLGGDRTEWELAFPVQRHPSNQAQVILHAKPHKEKA